MSNASIQWYLFLHFVILCSRSGLWVLLLLTDGTASQTQVLTVETCLLRFPSLYAVPHSNFKDNTQIV